MAKPKKFDEVPASDYDNVAKNRPRHQRSKSAITPEMLAQQSRRSSPQMQSLAEENSFVDNQEFERDDVVARAAEQARRNSIKEKRQSRNLGKPQETSGNGAEPQSEAFTSLQEIISTLRSLPPIQSSKPQDGKIRENGNAEAASPDKQYDEAARKAQQKRQSMPAIPFSKAASDNMSIPDVAAALQSTVAELRSISEKEKKDKKKRRESVGEGPDRKGKTKQIDSEDTISGSSRADALAETEAKLMGTYRRESVDYEDGSDDGKNRRRPNRQDAQQITNANQRNRRLSEPSARPNFGDQQQLAGDKDKQHRSSMQAQPSADSSSSSDKNGANSQKRISLQPRQLPTLTEASEDSQVSPTTPKGSKRSNFIKPLNLVQEGDKSQPKGQHNRRSSRNLEFDWRLSELQFIHMGIMLNLFCIF